MTPPGSADGGNNELSKRARPEGDLMRNLGYQNACLTVIAVLLGLNLLHRDAAPVIDTPASAQGYQPEAGGLSNALEQRKVMIAELRALGARLDRIEATLAKGMDVRVKDMPPMKLPPEVMRRLEMRPEPAPPAQAAAPAAPAPANEPK
jgi:hypothetical protein